MNRRFFLKSAAGAVLATPLLTSLRSEVSAAEPIPPRRSVIFHSPSGVITNRWFPKTENGPLDADALNGTSLEVLTPFANKLLIPRGLRGTIQRLDWPFGRQFHEQAMGSKLTCAATEPEDPYYATSHSLDWEIARQVNPGAADPLVLGPDYRGGMYVLSYSAPLTPAPSTPTPRVVYERLSGLLVNGAGEAGYRQRRGESILDAVRDDLQSYQRLNMSRSDRERVSTWLDLLRETETGMNACDPKNADLGEWNDDETYAHWYTAGSDRMMNVMALTMLCDTNRSFVMNFPTATVFNFDGLAHTRDNDALNHRGGSSFLGGTCLPDVNDLIAEVDTWFARKFAKLVHLFSSIPEGDVSLLDNTAALWLHEFSDGFAFNVNNMPIVIAGSAGGYLKQGVVVNVEGQPIGPGNSEAGCEDGEVSVEENLGSIGGNVPLNKLYVTLLNALGAKAEDGGPVQSFGQFDGEGPDTGITNPGELADLRA